MLNGQDLREAIDETYAIVEAHHHGGECMLALNAARRAADRGDPTPEAVEELGAGWTADEALSIAVFCALVAGDDFAAGVRLAANHSGDSDSTAAITGNILGALLGEAAIPRAWLEQLELRDTIASLATDLHDPRPDARGWIAKYPPW